jgi:hypothetical protein
LIDAAFRFTFAAGRELLETRGVGVMSKYFDNDEVDQLSYNVEKICSALNVQEEEARERVARMVLACPGGDATPDIERQLRAEQTAKRRG